MKIHEYQAKQILNKYGVRIPEGEVAETPARAREIAKKIGPRVVLKAQVHAGGRGKGGGIKLAENPEQAEILAQDMIGMTLVTPKRVLEASSSDGFWWKKLWISLTSFTWES